MIDVLVTLGLAALVTVLGVTILLHAYSLERERSQDRTRADIVAKLGATRARLEGVLTEPLMVSRGLHAQIVHHGGISNEDFGKLAAILLADYPAIRNITLARGTVISAVYPESGNRAALGVDYRNRADQWPMVERAIKDRQPVLAGPVALLQGGVALIGRVPIFLPPSGLSEPQLYGLISVVIDIQVILGTAGIDPDRLPFRLAIRGRDGKGAGGGMVWGDETILDDNPIEMDVSLPGGSWKLAAVPRGGWSNDNEDMRLTRVALSALGVLIGVVSFGFAFYIRSLRHARRAVTESEERYRALVDTAPMAVCVHRQGGVIYANAATYRLIGVSGERDLNGFCVFDLFPPEYRDKAERRVETVMAEGVKAPIVQSILNTLDGRTVHIDIVSCRITIDGEPAVLSVVNDVSLRVQAEKERERLVANLKRSNEDLLQFAHIASHDLQEPLRSVASYVQLLARRYSGRLDPDADQFIQFAVDGAVRMQEMISSLLDYSRIGEDGEKSHWTDSRVVVEKTLNTLSATIRDARAEVEVGDLPTLMIREQELRRIFLNLIGNALKYTRPGSPPHIRIDAELDGKEWRFSVADNGIGIAREHGEKIFGMFQRLHARNSYGAVGIGIGLAICRKLIQHNGGRIWVESQEGQGSTFLFTLPA